MGEKQNVQAKVQEHDVISNCFQPIIVISESLLAIFTSILHVLVFHEYPSTVKLIVLILEENSPSWKICYGGASFNIISVNTNLLCQTATRGPSPNSYSLTTAPQALHHNPSPRLHCTVAVLWLASPARCSGNPSPLVCRGRQW